jgi:HK97 gp10 family phage protein
MSSRIWCDVKVDVRRVSNLAASSQAIANNSSGAMAGKVVRLCKEESRVRTGAMKKGWTRTRIGSGYRGGWRVLNDEKHTIYNEFGTAHMAAKPMLRPAMEKIRGDVPYVVRNYISQSVTRILTDEGDKVEWR